MRNIVLIDTGTTNTRIVVFKDGKLAATHKENIGVKDVAVSGKKETLILGVGKAYRVVLEKSGIFDDEVNFIIGAGMITSNVGLMEIPHIKTPAGIEELAIAMKCGNFPEISKHPIWFVPGVKSSVDNLSIDNIFKMDFMRGEEAEAIALASRINVKSECVLILPGSHCKYILLDNNQKIVSSLTTMSGELLSVLTQNTILSDSLKGTFAESLNVDMIIKGANFAKEYGFARACFMVRLMERELALKPNDNANFLLGVVTYLDIEALIKHTEFGDVINKDIILGGNEMVTGAFQILLNEDNHFKGNIQVVAPEFMKNLSAYGSMLIAEKRGLL